MPTTHALDHRLLTTILEAGHRDLAPELAAATERLPLGAGAQGENRVALEATWLGYHALFAGRTLLDRFLAANEARLAPHERGWLHAQQRTAFSMHDVARIDLGAGLLLRDLLAGTETYVREAKATAYLRLRSVVCARVVTWNGTSVMVGMHPQPLRPIEADAAAAAARRRLGVGDGPVSLERLRDEECLPVLRAWGAALIAESEKPPPQLQNTDGDELVHVTDVYAFALERRADVVRRLADLRGADLELGEPGEDDLVTFSRPGNPMNPSWTNTIVATIEIGRESLRLRTNSLRRAALARQRIARSCKGLVLHRDRSRVNATEVLAGRERPPVEAAPSRPRPRIEPDVATQVIREMKERQYAMWPDLRILLLGNLTPRAATKHPDLRHRLELLLRDIESDESAEPPERRFDVAILRRTLGMPG